MYQSLMLGALVGASFAPRIAGAASHVAVGQNPRVAEKRGDTKQAGATVAAVSATSDDVMRIIRKASIEKAIDLTFWW